MDSYEDTFWFHVIKVAKSKKILDYLICIINVNKKKNKENIIYLIIQDIIKSKLSKTSFVSEFLI